jgi:uncharacterized protein YndB with AHSA1/START domain
MAAVTTTRVTRHLDAPRAAVYRALLDPGAVARWKVPEGMTCVVHEFDAREGGTLRVSLTYDEPGPQGEMTSTMTLADAPGGGTDLTAVHDGVPDGVALADNELGWRMALDRLAALFKDPLPPTTR